MAFERTFKRPAWAVKQITRQDAFARGLVEDICKHGVGHPNAAWIAGKAKHWAIHGCDGCCTGEALIDDTSHVATDHRGRP